MIPNNRVIITQLQIIQSDASIVDVSDHLIDSSIDCGSLSSAGDTGADGIARTLSFTLKNDIDNNFSPLSQKGAIKYATQTITGTGSNVYTLSYSNVIDESVRVREGTGFSDYTGTFAVSGTTLTCSNVIPVGSTVRIGYSYIDKTANNIWNTVGGSYSPLIFENRFVRMRTLIDVPTFESVTIYGTGANSYYLGVENIVRDTIRIKDVVGNGKTWDELGTWDSLGIWDSVSSASAFYTQSISYDYNTKMAYFDMAIPNGVIVKIQYSKLNASAKTIFEGYISEYTSQNSQITVTAKDMAKLLQDRFILKNEIRTYNTEYTDNVYYVTDTVASIKYTNGVPMETFLQNCLNDLGLSIILYTPVSPLYTILPKTEQWEYKTAWDLVQQFANNIGWSITSKYDSVSDSYRLTLIAVPRTKATADYTITSDDDIYVHELSVSGSSIRNSVTVGYNDANDNGNKKYCVLQEDLASILTYGKRPMIIEEENSWGIDTETEAVAMASAVLADCKDLQANVSIEMPLYPDIDLFTTLLVQNFRMSSTDSLVGVQSIRHVISPQNKQFRTSIMGCQKVIGGRAKWRNMQTRKDKFRQVTTKVADSIFAQVRDDTLHIKNQLQFDFWIQSMPTSSPTSDLSTAYTKVMLYENTYTMNYANRYIKMKKLNITCNGNVKININYTFGTVTNIFHVISDNFVWDNIDILLDGGTTTDGILFDILAYSNTDFTKVELKNSYFASQTRTHILLKYTGTKNNVSVSIHDNNIDNFIGFFLSYADGAVVNDLTIKDNIITGGNVFYTSKTIKNVTIEDNVIVDANINFFMAFFSGGDAFDNINISRNNFTFNTVYSNFYCINFVFTSTMTQDVINNMIISQNQINGGIIYGTTNNSLLRLGSTNSSGLKINCLNFIGNVAWSRAGSFITTWIKDVYSTYVINQQKPAVLDDYNSKF